ncbi:hypothetical protein [Burkholderia vietnamiensis]|uniref:hypothetical protein n=1 Tax=Burkholderia vietnamiensis TaxID=60552 RepID=UPI00352E6459
MTTTDNSRAAVRVCAIADIQCSRGCGTGPCKREAESLQPAAAPIEDVVGPLRDALRWRILAEAIEGSSGSAELSQLIGILDQCATKANIAKDFLKPFLSAPSPADERAAQELLPIDRKWVTAKAISLIAEYRNCKASETEEVMQRFVDYMQAALQDAAARAGEES